MDEGIEGTSSNNANVGAPVTVDDSIDDVGNVVYSVADYMLGSGDADSFTINDGSGQLTVGSTANLDHEMQSMYILKVIATAGTLTDTVKVTITVEDVKEAPMFTAASPTAFFVAEGMGVRAIGLPSGSNGS